MATVTTVKKIIVQMAQKAQRAARQLALIDTAAKNEAVRAMAAALLDEQQTILTENAKDVAAANKQKYPTALVDRLVLNEKRIRAMARCLEDTAALPNPAGNVLATYDRPNGLHIEKVSTPLGVVGIIYESRPNVTSDCAGLCLKAGNAVILKGGKEAAHSNKAIVTVLRAALKKTSLPVDSVQLVPSADRQALEVLLSLDEYVDVIVPRGGEGLIRFIAEHSRIPVIKHYKGVCHVYVSDQADLVMAEEIVFNAKVQRPGVCNAMETLLVHQGCAARFLPTMIARLVAAGVEIRGCTKTRAIVKKDVKAATTHDWREEYLDLILTVKVVSSTDEAIDHINTFGSHHSDAIVTKDPQEGDFFLRAVDSACVYVNASTRFTDGYEFGFGAEVGISTDKLHVRGPMGLEGLTTYKYVVHGKGQIRQ